MAPTNLEKAQKAEADALKNLDLIQDQATMVLDDADRLTHSERIPWRYLSKLQSASKEYEASVRAILAVLEDEDQKKSYTVKLTNQLAELDTLLIKLHNAVNTVDLEEDAETPIRSDNNKRIFSYIQIKVHTTEKTVNTKLQIVWDAGKEPGQIMSFTGS